MRVLSGRDFGVQDTAAGQPVVIVNATLADRFFAGVNPVGHRIAFDRPGDRTTWSTIVGVVADEKQDALDVEVQPEVYAPHTQDTRETMSIVVRTNGDPHALLPAIRQEIAALDSTVAIYDVRTLEEVVSASLGEERFSALVLSGFALTALLLAAVGLYGVVAFAATERTREIGIRLALGARRSDVLRMVVWTGTRIVVVGVAIGLAATALTARVLQSFLFETRAGDPLVLLAAAAALILVGLCASYVPAGELRAWIRPSAHGVTGTGPLAAGRLPRSSSAAYLSPQIGEMNGPALSIAVAAAVALILSASFISQVRHFLRDTFPNHFLLILAAIVGGSVALAVIAALLRIRDRRAARYTAIGAALVIGASYSLLTSSPDPQVAAVERFHFIQYGIIAFLFYRAWRPLGDGGVLLLPLLAAMLTGTLEEWFQWFIPGRVGTVEDVLLNWVAIACGLLFSVGFAPPTQSLLRFGSRSIRHGGTVAVLFVIVFGMFFDSVHLGYEIRDPKIGSFTSIYTQRQLEAHARDRASRWQTDPPIDRTRLAREDQYRTEGIQHVQERNEAWARGDIAGAWRENLILEAYYAPVVERGHRWPQEQKADALARAGEDVLNGGHGYRSQAYPYDLHTWPRAVFWGCTVGLAAAILVLVRYSPGRR